MTGLWTQTAVTQTRFRPDAVGQLLQLWHEVMPGDAPSAARFRDLALLNPAFRPDGLIMLWRGEHLIGFGYAIAGEPAGTAPGGPHGWLAGLGVAAAERGRGHGSRLLQSCLQYLRGAGCAVADLGGNGERYLLPGADAAAYPEFRGLIEAAGFRAAGSTQAMHCDLTGLPPEPAASRRGRYRYRHPGDGDLPELLTVAGGFSAGWAGLIRSYLGRTEHAENLWIARGPDGIAGFAGSDLFPGCPGRFGPMGVVPAARGHGAGSRLLRLSLASMAGRGRQSAWFLWGPEGESGRRMYASAGFQVSRQFDFFRLDLHEPRTPGPAQKGSREE
jgi:GNAT superfamily N-acetyltransferase